MKNIFKIFILFLLVVSCEPESLVPERAKDNSENGSATSRVAVTESLKVMSYNVYQVPSIMTQYKSKDRARGLLSFITNLGTNSPDVLVIEEGFNQTFGNEFLAKIKTLYPYATPLVGLYCSAGGGSTLYPNNWNSYSGDCGNTIFHVNGGIIILSKYPIEAKHQLVYNAKIGSLEGMSNRGVAYAMINKNGKKFHVFGTHTASEQPSYPGRATRELQFAEMKAFKNSFSIPAAEPVIYVGDMNVEYTLTSEYTGMKNILNAQINYAFNPFTTRGTYSNQNTVVQYQGYFDYNNTLDYIFFSNEHKLPDNFPVMQQLVAKSATVGDFSDHDPVLINYTYSY
jgi:phospholipase C